MVSDGSLEKVVQVHLRKNLWLLDPSWDRGTEAPIVEQAFKGLSTLSDLISELDMN